MQTIVSCHGLTRYYGEGANRVYAVHDVDLRIDRGEFVSLSGPSGSGKTTLLNLLSGLDLPDAGHVVFAGIRLDHLDSGQLADLRLRRIGFVFQAYNLIPVLSAEENVEFVLQLQGVDARVRRQRAHEMLEMVGLAGLGARRPGELSGGQQQRVAVARAMASNPEIVIADEPSANLDSASTDALLDLMEHLNVEHGITFCVASHDPAVIEFSRRRVRMRDGRIEADETA